MRDTRISHKRKKPLDKRLDQVVKASAEYYAKRLEAEEAYQEKMRIIDKNIRS